MQCIIRADEICVYDAVHQIIIMPYIHNIYYAVYYSLTDSIHSSINPFNKYAKKMYYYSSEIDILLYYIVWISLWNAKVQQQMAIL